MSQIILLICILIPLTCAVVFTITEDEIMLQQDKMNVDEFKRGSDEYLRNS